MMRIYFGNMKTSQDSPGGVMGWIINSELWHSEPVPPRTYDCVETKHASPAWYMTRRQRWSMTALDRPAGPIYPLYLAGIRCHHKTMLSILLLRGFFHLAFVLGSWVQTGVFLFIFVFGIFFSALEKISDVFGLFFSRFESSTLLKY